ncbi:uncharacterized protein LOC141903260 [Tubulanus polymorphus]|uniref:uncharacterized protein LOC141903260 n=1 Tax=Tubulanus polymorphus TaxID=672921 RepID=UPI003DA625CF
MDEVLRYKAEHTNNENHCDLIDGDLRKTIPVLHQLDSISLLWNADGVPIFKSSKFSIWPIQCTINELPPKIRKKHVLLCGLWFGTEKPVMNGNFLKRFVDESISLETEGLDWVDQSGRNHNTKIVNLLCSCDSPARAMLQNFKQYNGFYGCPYCLHEGERAVDNGNARIYPLNYPLPPLRNPLDTVAHATVAIESGRAVFVVKGPSDLILLPSFNLIESFTGEYLHSICLGVIRKFLAEWCETANAEYYIGNKIIQIDNRLQSIKPPMEVTRLPRSLVERKFWKGNEFRAFLLYSPVILSGILPNVYLSHWLLFVSDLYHRNLLTFNTHLALHLPDCVRRCGPLWSTSSFVFVGFAGKLKSFIHEFKTLSKLHQPASAL